MIKKSQLTVETYATIDELIRLGRIAVNEAQNDSRRLGIPNVYSINGRIYYETSTGELTTSDPYPNREKATDQSDEHGTADQT